ncbi:Bgt-50839 [Blumeria graminis f. sp. tritici]|uniref:Bgt-50839 n=1 Tax=Blumeria graminis f. sp. tritici TaxID=62690 RepID=A0A9X9MLB3_BLUGR|nr:Bgt-50839 [Blumeria graminis f. sp. tritici]
MEKAILRSKLIVLTPTLK